VLKIEYTKFQLGAHKKYSFKYIYINSPNLNLKYLGINIINFNHSMKSILWKYISSIYDNLFLCT